MSVRDFAERKVMETHAGSPDHSGLMLAARITLLHFSTSSAMYFLKSADEPESTIAPKIDEPRLEIGVSQAGIHFPIEPVARLIASDRPPTKMRLKAQHLD